MKTKGNILLACVFFTGLTGLWLADRAHLPTRADRGRAEGRVLPGLIETTPDEVRRIEIEGGAQKIVLERRGRDRWQMVEPLDVAADPTKVESLAFNLKALVRRPESGSTSQTNPASFGLASPERSVRIWGKSTTEPLAALDVGRISLDRRFVRSKGSEAVEAVDTRNLGLVDLEPIQWRDREIFRVPSFEVDRVTIQSAEQTQALELHRDRDAWRILQPIRALADGARIDGLAADLASIRVVKDAQFVADNVRDLARFGLDKPRLTISVEAGRGDLRRTTQILHVGKAVPETNDQFYARRDDQDDVFTLDGRSLHSINADPSRFRDVRIADVDPSRANAFEIDADGHTFALARFGKEWVITQPQGARADVAAVASFFKSLIDLKTSAFLTTAEVPDAGLDPANLTLRVWQAPLPGEQPESASSGDRPRPQLTLKIGRRDAVRKTVYARTDDDPHSILAIPETLASFLPRNSLIFRNRLVMAVAPDQIDRVSFEADGITKVINAPIFKMEGAGKKFANWWMGSPVSAPADMDSVERLLKLLSGLQATRLIADQVEDPAQYGFDQPVLKVKCSRPPASVREKTISGRSPLRLPPDDLTLVIGKALPDSLGVHYARIEGEPLVFAVGGEVLSVLDLEWHDHRVMTFPAEKVDHLSMVWPDRRIDFVGKSGDKPETKNWQFAGPVDAADLDPMRVEALVAALANLKTSRFIQYQGAIPEVTGLNPPMVRIQVDIKGGPPQEIRLGRSDRKGSLVATTAQGDSGPIFLLPEAGFGVWARAPRQQGDLPENVFAP